MEKILTVVVPSYNASAYLEETLPYILGTAYNDELEILIVNDGSTDDTLTVAKEWEARYPQTIKVIDKENGGHGSTINAGIDVAVGHYFKVIDADDWVNVEEFEKLIAFLKTTDVDEVVTPYNEVYENSDQIIKVEYLKGQEFDKIAYNNFLEKMSIVPQMHSVTIKTEILRNNRLYVGEKMFYVDTEYIVYPMPYIQSVAYKDFTVYQYRLGTQGQSVHINNYIKNRRMLKQVMFNIANFQMEEGRVWSSVQTELVNRTLRGMLSLLVNAYLAMDDIDQAKQEYIETEREIRDNFPQLLGKNGGSKLDLLRKSNHLFLPLSLYTRKWVYRKNK